MATRIEMGTLVSFDEVLSRLRRLMGGARVPEILALAKEAILKPNLSRKPKGESGERADRLARSAFGHAATSDGVAALLAKPGFILENQRDPLARMCLGGRGQTCGQLLF